MTRETFAVRAFFRVGCSATHLQRNAKRRLLRKVLNVSLFLSFLPDVLPVVLLADRQPEPGDRDPLPGVRARPAVLLRVRGGAHLPLAGEPADLGRRVAAAHQALQLELLPRGGHHRLGGGGGLGGGAAVAHLLHADAGGALWKRIFKLVSRKGEMKWCKFFFPYL